MSPSRVSRYYHGILTKIVERCGRAGLNPFPPGERGCVRPACLGPPSPSPGRGRVMGHEGFCQVSDGVEFRFFFAERASAVKLVHWMYT